MGVSVSDLGHDLPCMKYRVKVWKLGLGHENHFQTGQLRPGTQIDFQFQKKNWKSPRIHHLWWTNWLKTMYKRLFHHIHLLNQTRSIILLKRNQVLGQGRTNLTSLSSKHTNHRQDLCFFGSKQKNTSQSVEVTSIESPVSKTVVPKKSWQL